MLPHQCNEWLEKRPDLNDAQLEGIWQQLQNWGAYEKVSAEAEKDDQSAAEFLDHRHARSGLLAVLACLGRAWLQKNPTRRAEVESEIRKLLADPPKVSGFTADNTATTARGFWLDVSSNAGRYHRKAQNGAALLANFVTAYTYRTVWRLFDEAFGIPNELRGGGIESWKLLLCPLRLSDARQLGSCS